MRRQPRRVEACGVRRASTVCATSDILGDASDAEFEDDREPTGAGSFGDPTTLAFVAFPLAAATVLGAQVFRGLMYSVALAPAAAASFSVVDGGPKGSTAYLVIGAFLSAAFSLIPLALGWRGSRWPACRWCSGCWRR